MRGGDVPLCELGHARNGFVTGRKLHTQAYLPGQLARICHFSSVMAKN